MSLCILRNNLFRHLKKYYGKRYFSEDFHQIKNTLPNPVLDIDYIISNLDEYKNDIFLRKNSHYKELLFKFCEILKTNDKNARKELTSIAAQLPNWIHPDVRNYSNEFKIVRTVGSPKTYTFKPLNGTDLLKEKDLLKMEGLNHSCGERSYYLIGNAAKLEQALINYTIKKLIDKKFILVSVPDIICENIIESCGMTTKSERTQVYRLHPDIFGPELCLSGTSEMAFVAFLMNKNIPENMLPINYAAVSRCYRAEISALASEKGLYRVHQFTKVEMFGVCLPHQSESLLKMYRDIQEELFSSYDLHYRVIDMSPHELGCQAHRKYDIEAWMPGLNRFGEVTSCSNCTDYQSRRLNIKSKDVFLHSVNGTACAVPRTMNAILETHQIENGRVNVPDVLRTFIANDVIGLKRGPRLTKLMKLPTNIK